MSKSQVSGVIAIGAAVLVAIVFALESSIPRPSNVPAGTWAAPECRYDEAVRVAAELERDPKATSNSKDAVNKAMHDAQACEERARAWSDLKAQWQSARASTTNAELARLQVVGTGIEVLVLLAALSAAIWAAWETRKANWIATQSSEAQLRPYPALANATTLTLTFKDHSVKAQLELQVINAGFGPLFNFDCDVELYCLQAAAGGPSINNRILRDSLNVSVLPAGDAALTLQIRPASFILSDLLAAVKDTAADQAAYDMKFHVRCIITGRNYADRPIEKYVVWLEALDELPEGFLYPSNEQRIIKLSFTPPSLEDQFGTYRSRTMPPPTTLREEGDGQARQHESRKIQWQEGKALRPPWWRRLFK